MAVRSAHALRSAVCTFVLSWVVSGSIQAASIPAGFAESLIASGLQRPTAMAFAPDGRLFVCEQDGDLRVISGGVLLPTPFVTITVNDSGERGLLGVAFDPGFESNNFVYVYYTATGPTIHNRVSRFTANGNVAVPGSEVVIMDLETLSGATNHNGGAIHFGPDGKLYIAVGENANGSNSQTLANRLGKMLRINSDGTIPTNNPFYTTAIGVNRSIWALGLRNPFTFSFHPLTGAMFINDVGQNTWEEINEGLPGANYGWPDTEGATSNPNFTSPVYAYDHANGCAITGGAFYAPATAQYPGAYYGNYFFADFCGGWIRRRTTGGAIIDFASGISAPVDVQISSDGSLYYLARGASAGAGVVRRIRFTGPVVNVTANGGDEPLTLGSGDPLAVSISFDSGTSPSLNPAEVYIAVAAPSGVFWLDPNSGTFVSTVTRIYAGPLADFGPSTLFSLSSASALPPGSYLWLMFVDDDSNGVPNGTFFDFVQTIVQ